MADRADGAASELPSEVRDLLQLQLGDATPSESDDPSGTDDPGRSQEEFLDACFAEQGFGWWEAGAISNVNAQIQKQQAGGGPLTTSGSDEFAAQYGFGISTLIDLQATSVVDIEDPNAERLAAMSPAERQAFDQAEAKCGREFQAQRPTYQGRVDPENAAQAAKAISDVENATRNDPRVVAATRDWSTCMNDAGFDYQSPTDLRSTITDRTAPFREAYQSAAKQSAGSPGGLPSMDEVLSPAQLAKLRDVQQFEVAAAQADQDCGSDLRAIYEQVHDETLRAQLGG